MRIFQAFQDLRLTQDQENALKKIEGFLASDKEVFILKGYAGTGKTTMLDGLVKYLKDQGRSSHLFAPTGRAAKVLKEKTGEGSTIHRGIYNFEKLECVNVSSKEDSVKSFHYYFPVNDVNETGRVCLVDEASMISSKQDRHELFSFGTDQLLADLLTFMKTGAGLNKIIFIGDPAQLPPVTDSESYALSEDYFQGKAIPFDSCELKEVNRQKEGNTVLNNATRLRELLDSKKRANLQFDYDDQFVNLDPAQVVDQYVAKFPRPEIGNSVIISFSNAQCLHYNQWTRQKYFPEASRVQPGDILMINHNNYHTYDIELYNGDMAKVIEASDFTEKQSAEVKDYEGGHGIKKRITLEFRDLKLEVPGYSGLVSCKIIDSLLNSPERDLTIAEQKALYINFNVRNNEANKKRRERGEKDIKEGSEGFKETLKADPYFNALRVKYGYAVTCHKAQGGEWEQVFVNFRGRIGLKDDQLRWAYTAITRGSEKVYAINAPVFSHFSKLEFDETETISKVPEHAIQYNNIPKSPFHDNDAHPCKHLKYFEVQEKIKNTPYVLERIDSKPYHEIYWFSRAEQHCRVDAHHDKAGFFKAFIPNKKQDEDKKLLEILNAPYVDSFIAVDYKPSTNELKELYSRVQFYCAELNILIINIEERLEEHFVRYFLQTDAQCALIQFYFDKNNRFGKALPKSKLGNKDERLSQLIEALSENKIPERSAAHTDELGAEGYLNTGLVNEPETNYNASYNQSSNTEEKDLGQTGIAPDYQVEETVNLQKKNHGAQIKELRKTGDRKKLKEAFNLADQDLKANPGGVWENRNMAWVLFEFLKEKNAPESFEKFNKVLEKLKSLELAEDESVLFDATLFQVNGLLTKSLNKEKPDLLILNDLFSIIKQFHFPKPSYKYSYLHKMFLKANKQNWSGYLEFANWWGFQNFRDEDFQKEELKDGTKIISLAERAYIAYSRHLLDDQKWLFSKNLTQREAIRSFLPWLDEVIEKHQDMVYPPYYKAKLLLKTGENERDTLKALRPFVQRKSNEFWAWETMADVFQENDDRKLACLCKALSFNSSEEFIINLRHKMASELIKREHYQAAKAEIEKIVEIREQNGWNILNTVKEWQNQEWYQSTQANQDNTELYQKNAPQADEILYEDTPEKNVVVEFVNKHKKVLNFVKDQSFSGFFNYAGYLEKPEIGDILKVRLKPEGNEGYHKVLTLQKDDETKDHPAITDFQGQIKLKPPHNFGLVSSDNGKIFIHSKMVEKNKIEDKTGISGKAVLSYNKKRGEWEWKAIIVNG